MIVVQDVALDVEATVQVDVVTAVQDAVIVQGHVEVTV